MAPERRSLRQYHPLRVATWNVRTLIDHDRTDRPERRSALVGKELDRYKIDIAALSETRLSDDGSCEERASRYTFFWRGKPANEHRIHGVGFAVRTHLVREHNLVPTAVNERLMTLRVPLSNGHFVTLISVYAPTLNTDDDIKDAFYNDLRTCLTHIPRHDKLIVLGDFNARVGRDFETWPGILGKEGIGSCNANGLLLLGLCTEFELILTNTLFRQKNSFKTTWMHPRSKHWHLIDYILTRTKDRSDVHLTRVAKGADDCWTDHKMVYAILSLKLKSPPPGHRPKFHRIRYAVNRLKNPAVAQAFVNRMSDSLQHAPTDEEDSIDEAWIKLKNAVKQAADAEIGSERRVHRDWFDENDAAIAQLIDRKRQARLAAENNPDSASNKARYQELKAIIQTALRTIQTEWWEKMASDIQGYADGRDWRRFFQAVNAVYGTTSNASHPLRSSDNTTLLKDNDNIMKRWTEHFSQLLNRPTTVADDALDSIPQYPLQNNMDDPPILPEISRAISQMKNNKACGPDGIPAEVYKFGGPQLTSRLHDLFTRIWETEQVPSDLKDAMIVTIFKKGDRSVCGNYRGIALLSIAGKVLSRVLLNRLITLAETILPESQCGFRGGRGTTDMIFVARQLMEKSVEQHRDLHMIFIDIEKAFDSVCRRTLWRVLERFGCPPRFTAILSALHNHMLGKVIYGGTVSEPFPIKTGVKQGCVLAPVLFALYLAAVDMHVKTERTIGIPLRYRLDGCLFNLRRLRTTTKTSDTTVSELQYADDNGIMAHEGAELQDSTTAWDEGYRKFGLKMNYDKTKMLSLTSNEQDYRIQVANNNTIECVQRFVYLGSTLSSDNSLDQEITNRIRAAHCSYGRLMRRVFLNHGLRTCTKLAVYQAVVVSSLLYGCETWTLYSRHLKLLEQFHIGKLRRLLRIRWEDRVPNDDVLLRANMQSMEGVIMRHRLRWLGHVQRMPPDRMPVKVLYSELSDGKRSAGGPRKRYKDQLKRSLIAVKIPPEDLPTATSDRTQWRRQCDTGIKQLEAHRRTQNSQKRQRKKKRADDRARGLGPPPTIPCDKCDRFFFSRLGLYSHSRTH